MTLRVEPLGGIPEVRPGDDLPRMLVDALRRNALDLTDGDVVVVTQKVVSKAEGRLVQEGPDGKRAWVDRETASVVAERGETLIARTRHGFVCANAGVDASNVPEGFLTLLPEDPDGSAERIRDAVATATGRRVGVVVTDTFGRAWRTGQVDVAIGCAGMAPLLDLRGTQDATGRTLQATVLAVADAVAAAAGLVMAKAGNVPAAVVSGLPPGGEPGRAEMLVRPLEEDLFRWSPLRFLHSRRSIRVFGSGPVPTEALEEAVRAACTAPAPHHTRPWLFVALTSDAAKRRLLEAMRAAWVADLRGDGTPEHVIRRRVDRSDALLGQAPVIVVPCVRLDGSHSYPDEERAAAEREMFLLSGGASIQTLMLALHAEGLASCWVSSTLFCKEETREALGLDEGWIPLGSVAVGPAPVGEPPPRPPLDVERFLREM